MGFPFKMRIKITRSKSNMGRLNNAANTYVNWFPESSSITGSQQEDAMSCKAKQHIKNPINKEPQSPIKILNFLEKLKNKKAINDPMITKLKIEK